MTQSMTGFARGSVSTGAQTVTVECRSVNNRFLDIQFRMPETMREYEAALREQVNKAFSRGKLELTIRAHENASYSPVTIDRERLEAFQSAFAEISEALPESKTPDQLSVLLAPGVLVEQASDTEALRSATTEALGQCLSELREQRLAEGRKLAVMVQERCTAIRTQLEVLRAELPALQTAHRQKLLSRLDALDIEADANRLEEEIVYILQRADVEEEMDRLGAHLDAIETALSGNVPCGRRLDFLMQELNREANTLGSKSTALSTTNTSVEFKVLIEQMREQIQNIE
ncbi:MAG: YicC/YloC family endoribonuclease [Halieaceae bacterium]